MRLRLWLNYVSRLSSIPNQSKTPRKSVFESKPFVNWIKLFPASRKQMRRHKNKGSAPGHLLPVLSYFPLLTPCVSQVESFELLELTDNAAVVALIANDESLLHCK